MTVVPQPSLSNGTLCIWCGERTDGQDDGGSFLFLTMLDGEVQAVFGGQPSSSLQGLQFSCHAKCFRDSVPAVRRHWIDGLLDFQQDIAGLPPGKARQD
jgi:hypothetical protein